MKFEVNLKFRMSWELRLEMIKTILILIIIIIITIIIIIIIIIIMILLSLSLSLCVYIWDPLAGPEVGRQAARKMFFQTPDPQIPGSPDPCLGNFSSSGGSHRIGRVLISGKASV
jgi:disulfide bond formation protein DsbB